MINRNYAAKRRARDFRDTPCVYMYMRDRAPAVYTDTSRDDTDVDGDVPQDVLLNPENGGGIEAWRGARSRILARARARPSVRPCGDANWSDPGCRQGGIDAEGRTAPL